MKNDQHKINDEAEKALMYGDGIVPDNELDYCEDEQTDTDSLADVELSSDDSENTKINTLSHQSPTRRIINPVKNFSIAINIECKSDEHFIITFLNGSIVAIDRNTLVSNDKKNYALYARISQEISNNIVSIPLNSFDKGCDILKILKQDYENTILKDFFGKYVFLLVINENGNFMDVNHKNVGCSFIFSEHLGLLKR
jgi:hypothetical protein